MKRKIQLLALVGALLLASPAWGAAGGLLWEQTISFNPNTTTVEITSMVASTTRFIITGSFNPISQGGPNGKAGFIKAFDAATPGTPRWDKTVTGGYDNSVIIMAVDRDLLINREISYTSHEVNRTTLKCYVADSGQQLWAVPMDYVQSPMEGVFSLVANNRVFSVVIPVDPVGNQTGTIVVRAYQERNVPLNTMLWLE